MVLEGQLRFKQVQSQYENKYELFKAAELCKV